MATGKKITRAQAATIARGKVAGKPRAEIAREAGVSEATVSHANSNPQIAPLMRRLVAQHDAALMRLYGRLLAAVERDLDANEAWLRVQTREQALKLVQAADAVSVQQQHASGGDGAAEGGSYTLRELLVTYREALRRKAGDDDA